MQDMEMQTRKQFARSSNTSSPCDCRSRAALAQGKRGAATLIGWVGRTRVNEKTNKERDTTTQTHKY